MQIAHNPNLGNTEVSPGLSGTDIFITAQHSETGNTYCVKLFVQEPVRVTPGLYKHFKGGYYLVLGLTQMFHRTEQNGSQRRMYVVYLPLYNKIHYMIRPIELFEDFIEREEYYGPRFSLEHELVSLSV